MLRLFLGSNIRSQFNLSRLASRNIHGTTISALDSSDKANDTKSKATQGFIGNLFSDFSENVKLCPSEALKHMNDKHCGQKLFNNVLSYSDEKNTSYNTVVTPFKDKNLLILYSLSKYVVEKDNQEWGSLYESNKKANVGGGEVDLAHIRNIIAKSTEHMMSFGVKNIMFDPSYDPLLISETAHLSSYRYKKEDECQISCFTEHLNSAEKVKKIEHLWNKGKIMANAQNLARYWTDLPSNKLHPTKFAESIAEKLSSVSDDVKVTIRNAEWCREHKFTGLAGVGQASQNYTFVEVEYMGDKSSPKDHVALVGKGVTFDTGGISLKPSLKMGEMKTDMGGAAVVASTVHGVASLKLPINVKAYIPICDNMPGPNALKPGDVLSMGEYNIEITNTDAEGRLILADALRYATMNENRPKLVIDLATLTGAITVALGNVYSGLFSNEAACKFLAKEFNKNVMQSSAKNLSLQELLIQCGEDKLDPMWPMPTAKFSALMTKTISADFVNSEESRLAGSSFAAAFLKLFVEKNTPWMHLDIAGVTRDGGKVQNKDVSSGRPTRVLIHYLEKLCQ